jgi:hypothetical protein
MRQVGWMVGGTVAVLVALMAVLDRGTWSAVTAGVAGPLVAAVVTWLMVDRTFRRAPKQLTGFMAAGFVAKLVFFGGYVAIMLRPLALPPVPFMIGFTASMIVFYGLEALLMQRLFRASMSGAGRAAH